MNRNFMSGGLFATRASVNRSLTASTRQCEADVADGNLRSESIAIVCAESKTLA